MSNTKINGYSPKSPYTVGVLALQGGFTAHLEAIANLDADIQNDTSGTPLLKGVEIRATADLENVDALILPGGESTSIGNAIAACPGDMLEKLREFVAAKKPVWGICAGLILLAEKVVVSGIDRSNTQTDQHLIGGLDVTVSRNYFGRQSASRFRQMEIMPQGEKTRQVGAEAYFIRAPAVLECGPGVTELARADGIGVAVEQRPHILGTAFHPEISADPSWLRYFLQEFSGLSLPTPTRGPPLGRATALLSAPWLPKSELASMEGVKRAFMVFQQGGVIMDVVNAEQARVAERAGAVSVMALERIPADIKKDGGIARASDPSMIREIMEATSIPVMAKARIGHFAEAQIIEALDADCIDESEVLTCADELHHIDKRAFTIPFVCGAKDLGEAMRRIGEGAAMIRLKGNAGTGNVLHAVRHARKVFSEIRALRSLREDELFVFAKEHQVPLEIVRQTRSAGRLPVVTFAAGGLATPADVSLLMQLGCDGVFVGSGIFKGSNPEQRARAMVEACSHYRDPKILARVSSNLGKAMVGVLDSKGETYALGGANADDKL